MGIETTHPLYDAFLPDWEQQRDLYAGERVVKAKDEVYLPALPSMHLDGMKQGQVGRKNYDAYKTRAYFADYVREAVEAYVGMIHHKPSTFELPAGMEQLIEKATLTGESLQDLLRQITAEQLLTGRVGLLADMPEEPDQTNPIPYIAMYVAESMRNWDDAEDQENRVTLNLVILDEQGYVRDSDFVWKKMKKYRVLILGEPNANEAKATYRMGVFSDKDGNALVFDPTLMKTPTLRGATLQEIPFVFINTKDLLATPDDSPSLGLGRLTLAIYRGDADYRQTLFLTGQDTLVVIGGVRNPDGVPGEDPEAVRVGAGSRIDVDIGGGAEYIGVNGQGLTEQGKSLENDRRRAELKAGQLIPAKNQVESGQALKTRVSAQTASMTQIAQTAAKGLETILRKIAVWMGKDPNKVKVTPNLEFGELNIETKDFQSLMAARTQGLPLSKKSIHNVLRERRLTNMEYEQEIQQIKEEDADMPPPVPGAGREPAETE